MVNVGGTGSHGLRFAIGEVAPTAYVFLVCGGGSHSLHFRCRDGALWDKEGYLEKLHRIDISRVPEDLWGLIGALWEPTGNRLGRQHEYAPFMFSRECQFRIFPVNPFNLCAAKKRARPHTKRRTEPGKSHKKRHSIIPPQQKTGLWSVDP